MREKKGKIVKKVGWALFAISAILIMLVASDIANDVVAWIGVAIILAGAVVVVTGQCIISLPRSTYPKNMSRYKKLPPVSPVDYKKELQAVRANFAADFSADKNKIEVVPFANSTPYYDFKVINSGKIYYAYLVEANNLLFEPKKYGMPTHPAVVVYSPDEYFENNPLALRKLAEYMYRTKNSTNGWAGKLLNDELHYFANKQVPTELTDGREVYMTTIMIYRKHLPLGFISDSLFPIVAAPKSSTAVFVVDVKYWTEPLIGNFVNSYSTQAKSALEENNQ